MICTRGKREFSISKGNSRSREAGVPAKIDRTPSILPIVDERYLRLLCYLTSNPDGLVLERRPRTQPSFTRDGAMTVASATSSEPPSILSDRPIYRGVAADIVRRESVRHVPSIARTRSAGETPPSSDPRLSAPLSEHHQAQNDLPTFECAD